MEDLRVRRPQSGEFVGSRRSLLSKQRVQSRDRCRTSELCPRRARIGLGKTGIRARDAARLAGEVAAEINRRFRQDLLSALSPGLFPAGFNTATNLPTVLNPGSASFWDFLKAGGGFLPIVGSLVAVADALRILRAAVTPLGRGRDIAWGISWGLRLAAGLSVLAIPTLCIRGIRGGASPAAVATPIIVTLAFYVIAAFVAGGLVGLLRPLATTWSRTVTIGFAAAYPVALGGLLAIVGPDRLSVPVLTAAGVVAAIWAVVAGTMIWKDP